MVKPTGLTKKFRGLKPQEVDQYMEKLKQSHIDDIENLEKQIIDAQQQKELLTRRLVELQEEWANKTEEKDILDLALRRVKYTKGILIQKASKEAEELLKVAEENSETIKKSIRDIEEEIAITKLHIQSLLDSMKKIFQEPEKAAEAAEQISSKIIKFKERINEKKTHAPEVTEEEKVQVEKAKEESWLQDYKITADGTGLSDITNKSYKKEDNKQFDRMMEDLAKALNPHQVQRETEVSEDTTTNKQTIEEPNGNSFWTDENKAAEETASAVEDIINEKIQGPEDEIAMIDGVLQKIAAGEANPKQNSDDFFGTNEDVISNNSVRESLPEPKQEIERHEDSILGSPAVAAEINNVRHKYITGKLAGQDLTDKNGNMIIAKGEVITSEVVARVEAEGKLPVLIVNMVLPGMEE